MGFSSETYLFHFPHGVEERKGGKGTTEELLTLPLSSPFNEKKEHIDTLTIFLVHHIDCAASPDHIPPKDVSVMSVTAVVPSWIALSFPMVTGSCVRRKNSAFRI